MELIDESMYNGKKQKNKNIYKILIIGIAVLIILVILVISLIIYLQGTIWTVELNGETASELKDMVIVDDKDTSKIYIPIRRMSDYVGYESFRGDFINLSEEDTKCYVETPNETVMFIEGSNIITKKGVDSSNSELEYVEIDEPIVRKDNELCTTVYGMQKALNFVISYNYSEKTLKAYTLEYLYSTYEEKAADYGYESLSEQYDNQKALLENIIVGERNGMYGAYDLETGEIILENKYKDVLYIEETTDFLVTGTNNKKGIITKTKENKLDVIYDNINIVKENDRIIYMVIENSKVGMYDENGEVIINAVIDNVYDEIGIDASNFKENGVENGLLLLDTLIPVKDNNLWGFIDKNGNQIIECQYDTLGCINSQEGRENVLVIESQNVIVVGNDGKYTVITLDGTELYEMELDSVYMTVEEEEITYYLTSGSQTVNAEDNIARKLRNI